MVIDLTFIKVNDQVIKCVIPADEIRSLGFQVEEIFSSKEKATEFIKEVVAAASSQGFIKEDTYQFVNQIGYDNNELVMNVVSVSVDKQINSTVSRLLSAYDMVNCIGRQRLEDILRATGEEKIMGFNQVMNELNSSIEQKSEDTEVQEDRRYVIRFSSLDDAERFCESADEIGNGRMYKSDNKYFMYVDLNGADSGDANRFLLTAEEYSEEIIEADWCQPYLSEHAQVIIKENPVSVLKNL